MYVIFYMAKRKVDKAPKIIVNATIISKRIQNGPMFGQVSGGVSDNKNFYSIPTSTYYATFQLEDGSRIELNVGRDYGLLLEGERGRLTYQSVRYLGFERF